MDDLVGSTLIDRPKIATKFSTFDSIYGHLKTEYPITTLFASSSLKPHDVRMSHYISLLAIHPSLEAILHLLNNDLSSSHFLCRHMQAAPAWEGMLVHGLLHQIEGDYRNAEAWYDSVKDSDCFTHVWPSGIDEATKLLLDIERLKKEKIGNEIALRQRVWKAIDSLADWCKGRFRTEVVTDATKFWVQPTKETSEIASSMIVGGEGWRKF